jgi:threonyl-tRNA synthetase
VVREELPRQKAIDLFASQGESFKVALLQDLENPTVSLYRQGNFIDLCRGPHLASTESIRFFKLTQVAGAYWRGDERNPMLQRIYGTAFFDRKALEDHLHRLEEARRAILPGRIRSFGSDEGPGLVIYPGQVRLHPGGFEKRTFEARL